MMLSDFSQHVVYHSMQGILLLLGLFFVLQVSYDKTLQMLGVVMTAFLYVVFGILHHITEHDITAKIVVEYILIAGLGVSLVFLLLKGSI